MGSLCVAAVYIYIYIYIYIKSPPQESYWQVGIDDITFDNTPKNLCGSGGCEVAAYLLYVYYMLCVHTLYIYIYMYIYTLYILHIIVIF